MSIAVDSLALLSDAAITTRVEECVAQERRATAELLAALGEFDLRRLYLGYGSRSLFMYCTDHLHLSERAAYTRIEAARLARRFPVILTLIADSRVSLTAVSMLARHLSESNHRELLEAATHKTAKQVEVMVARLNPKPDAVAMVRRVPAPPPAASVALPTANETASSSQLPPLPDVPPSRPVIKPLAPERFRIQFTISGETRERLRKTQDLLRHSVAAGDIAAVFDRALVALLADLEKKKLALVARPRAKSKPAREGSRAIPAAVRRAVWRRDRGRCAFVGSGGRCRERGALEFHHVVPFAAGGATTVENIQLRCRAHNAHEADVVATSPRPFRRG